MYASVQAQEPAGSSYLPRRPTPSLSRCCSTLPQAVDQLRSQVATLQDEVDGLPQQQLRDTWQSDLEARLMQALDAKLAALPTQASVPADLPADELQRLRKAFADLQVQVLKIIPTTAAADQIIADDLLATQDKVDRLARQVAAVPGVPPLEQPNPQLAADAAARKAVRNAALAALNSLKPQLP